MTNINVALTNLGRYNEGALVFEWLSLPATDDEIKAALDKIGINAQYEEFFISDYEAPFVIGEYASLDKLNEFAEELEGFSEWNAIASDQWDAGDLISFANEAGHDEMVQDLVNTDDLDELAAQEAEANGWQRVLYFLSGIDYTSEDYYMIDGYANARNIRPGELESILDEILGEMLHEYEI